MKKAYICAVLLAVSSVSWALDYEPWTYRENFDTGELMAWSSYPPVQDTAYEAPFIHPGIMVPGETDTCLVKTVYPQWDAPQIVGAVKRLSMRLGTTGSVRFRYYLKTIQAPSWLGIDLPLASGGRIRARFPAPQTGRWVEFSASLPEILSATETTLSGPADITALAVTIRFERGDPAMPIVLGLDDVVVSGMRAARFAFEEPPVEQLAEWEQDIALTHYRPGDTMTVRGTFPSSSPERAEIVITRFDRPETVTAEKRLIRRDGLWEKTIPLDAKFPAGMYEARITGTTKGETVAGGAMTFMVLDRAQFVSHPRFWFNSAGKGDFAARLKESHPEFYAHILSEARDARERYDLSLPYDLPAFPTVGWLKSFEAYRTRIATIPQRALANAVIYAVDGDPEAGEWAKTALLALTGWPTWTHPWMRAHGHAIYLYQWYTTYNFALTYDIIHDLLDDNERARVRDAFIRNGLEPAYHTYVRADMVTCNESNWITAVTGGALTAVCAVMDEMDDTSVLEPWFSGCLLKMRAHMRTVYSGDSGCIEGFGYGYGTMRMYGECLPPIESTLGLDLGYMLEGTYGEALWTGDHEAGVYYSFGDAHLNGGNVFSGLPWLVERFRDPELAWLMDRNPITPSFYTWFTVLNDTGGVPRREPVLSGAKLFETTGTAVFRSSVGPDPFIFVFRSGPFGNHQHIDQGTFYLRDRGETLLTEYGYSSYYDDPIYQSRIIQPVGHNCILVDGNPMSQRTGDHESYAAGMNDRASIATFVPGNAMSFTAGNLDPVYTGNVRTLARNMLYIAPRTVIAVDCLETRSGEADMDVLFHGPSAADMSIGNGSFAVASGGTTLRGVCIAPADATINLDADPLKLADFTDEPLEPMGRVTVSVPTKGGRACSAVMLSTNNSVRRSATAMGATLAEIDGARLLINPTGEISVIEGLGSDGLIAAVAVDGAVMAIDATNVSIDARRLFQSDHPLSVLFEDGNVTFDSAAPAEVRLSVNEKVKTVHIDSQPIKGWKFDSAAGVVSMTIPAGRGTVTFE